MKIKPILIAAGLFLTPAVSALAQQTTGPEIRADNKKEATEIKDGHAVTPPNNKGHDQMSSSASNNPGPSANTSSHQ